MDIELQFLLKHGVDRPFDSTFAHRRYCLPRRPRTDTGNDRHRKSPLIALN